MWLDRLKSRLFPPTPLQAILANTLETWPALAPKVLILSGSKRNQNYYRDIELARQTRALLVAEGHDFAAYDWDISRLCQDQMGGAPDWVFLNYIQSYTPQLKGFEALGAPVLGFVGDHYNFLDQTPAALAKQTFFRSLPLAGMVTAYPHTSNAVAQAMGWKDLPFLHLPWAIDPTVFRDLETKRRYDIACMGALTEGKYPFRRQVRVWLETQRELRLFGKKRVKGRGGSDHDGEAFNQALNRVRSAFTCASAMRYLLMKYFEIPGAGALMFAESIPDLEALGFRDGEHFVAVTPENFSTLMRYYLTGAGQEEGESIRRRGHDFVHQHHTWNRRIADFLPQANRLARPGTP